MKRFYVVFSMLTLGLVAQDLPTVRLAVRGADGLTELAQGLDPDEDVVRGFRGCANGAASCELSHQINAVRAAAQSGETLVVLLSGEPTAERVRITRGTEVVMDTRSVQLPTQIEVGVLGQGDRVDVQVYAGLDYLEASATVTKAGKFGRNSVSGVNIRNYVWAAPRNKPAGFYQVIEGSGTGGGFVVNWSWDEYVGSVEGYTDRASRGEDVCSIFRGTGYASRAGWKYEGSGKVLASDKWLPYVRPVRSVSTNPADDYLYAFAESPVTRKRIPIGTR